MPSLRAGAHGKRDLALLSLGGFFPGHFSLDFGGEGVVGKRAPGISSPKNGMKEFGLAHMIMEN